MGRSNIRFVFTTYFGAVIQIGFCALKLAKNKNEIITVISFISLVLKFKIKCNKLIGVQLLFLILFKIIKLSNEK